MYSPLRHLPRQFSLSAQTRSRHFVVQNGPSFLLKKLHPPTIFFFRCRPTSSTHFPFPIFRRCLSSSSRTWLRYEPSNRRHNQISKFLDRIPSNVVFYSIIGLNATVFAMWLLATEKYKQEKDVSGLLWMQQNFTNNWNNLVSGRIWTPLAACFSQKDWSHILLNGFTFFFMAGPVLRLLGNRQFILLYLGGGLISSFSSILYARFSGKDNFSSHGASGAIYSVVSLLACVAPRMTFQLYGIIPVPAWLAVAGLFSYDLYSTVSNKTGRTDAVGHIGGIMAGIGYFLIRRFR